MIIIIIIIKQTGTVQKMFNGTKTTHIWHTCVRTDIVNKFVSTQYNNNIVFWNKKIKQTYCNHKLCRSRFRVLTCNFARWLSQQQHYVLFVQLVVIHNKCNTSTGFYECRTGFVKWFMTEQLNKILVYLTVLDGQGCIRGYSKTCVATQGHMSEAIVFKKSKKTYVDNTDVSGGISQSCKIRSRVWSNQR